jgi:hypothetical protein
MHQRKLEERKLIKEGGRSLYIQEARSDESHFSIKQRLETIGK